MAKLAFVIFGLLSIVNSLSAQVGCSTQLKPLRPPSAGNNATLLCLCPQDGVGCHWEWAASKEQSGGGIDPTIPLRVQNPPAIDVIDTLTRAQELRNARNQQPRPIKFREQPPIFPIATAYGNMPSPTGNEKTDRENWNSWRKQNKYAKGLLPDWSPGAYEEVRLRMEKEVSAPLPK